MKMAKKVKIMAGYEEYCIIEDNINEIDIELC